MKAAIIYFREEQHEKLRQQAFDKRISINEVVRNAVDKYLNTPSVPPHREFIPRGYRIDKKTVEAQLPEDTKIVRTTHPVLDDSTPESLMGKCEVPNMSCRGFGKKYRIEYFDTEGLQKKEVYLCPEHAKKTREYAESMVEI